jgi:hypothetical protein
MYIKHCKGIVMPIDFKKARDFVYANGTLWERALFAYLFQHGSLERVHQCLLCYKNPDNGFGHALEHDIRYPDSHPLALEYLLRVLQDTDLPVGNLLDGTAAWVQANQQEDGFLVRKPELMDYPYAPWWNEGGQNIPDAVVGGLMKFGQANAALINKTRQWVEQHLTLDSIRNQEWLFMLYHPFDYFNADNEFPDVEAYRAATIEQIVKLGQQAPDNQLYSLFMFVHSPQSAVAQAAPQLVERALAVLESSQLEHGGWQDQHGLPQWSSYWTILSLLTLRRFERWSSDS